MKVDPRLVMLKKAAYFSISKISCSLLTQNSHSLLLFFFFQISPVKICDFDLASGLDGLSTAVTTPELQTPVNMSACDSLFTATLKLSPQGRGWLHVCTG